MSSAAPAQVNAGTAPGSALVAVSGLRKYFPVTGGLFGRVVNQVRAVEDVTFEIERGETLGLVGESGCGKTTVGRLVLRLLEPTSGSVRLSGTEVYAQSTRAMRALRRKMQIVFQDPFASLDPRMTVGSIIAEPMRIHRIGRGDEAARVRTLMRKVGLNPEHVSRFPHEFSGGQRQRIGIARALALEPELLVLD